MVVGFVAGAVVAIAAIALVARRRERAIQENRRQRRR
jgi:hypothetical protein